MISETARRLCVRDGGSSADFWTAGQRADLHSQNLPFVWKVLRNATAFTVSEMDYLNWDDGLPSAVRDYSCMYLSQGSNKWRDLWCNQNLCALCELDL